MKNGPAGRKSCAELLAFDNNIRRSVSGNIAGVDEAGRGALAGPVVAAALICDFHKDLSGVRDSKLLSEKRREELYEVIMNKCVCVNVGIVEPVVIDNINILNATLVAMKNAVEGLKVSADFVIVDGRDVPDICKRAEPVIEVMGKVLLLPLHPLLPRLHVIE